MKATVGSSIDSIYFGTTGCFILLSTCFNVVHIFMMQVTPAQKPHRKVIWPHFYEKKHTGFIATFLLAQKQLKFS